MLRREEGGHHADRAGSDDQDFGLIVFRHKTAMRFFQ
jgi:hypothetical protein